MQSLTHLWQDVQEIELEIIRKGVAINMDWNDPIQVTLLAREALAYHRNHRKFDEPHLAVRHPGDSARQELFGLAGLMLKTMEQTATDGVEAHGGSVWKTFARALWEARGPTP